MLTVRLSSCTYSAFNAVHGAGEVIRGTINDGADKLGEGIASDGKTTGTDEQRQHDLARQGHSPQDHGSTVEQGKEQVQQGISSLSNPGQDGGQRSA